MFNSSSPFGQSSSSPFGTPSVFGQTNNATNNPFAPKPFGSTSPFGSQTGSSLFGGTSTGVFGAQSSSPLASTPVFGASSSPAFGSAMPSFGASSTPAFGGSAFGQKPAFGGFGSSTPQSSPFGSSFQQSQPAFGSNLFGSSTSTFGASSTPAFGAASTPAFGASSTPAFGATSTPSFGATSTQAFGATSTPAFGSTATPAFGSTGSAFGSTSVFGTSSPAFGTSGTPAFGASNSVFGSSSTPAFGAPTTPAFGASSSPSFSFAASAPAFGQSSSAFGSSPFGTTPSPFGAQSSPFGAQTATTPTFGTPGFGQNTFGGQRGGSRVAAYTPTPEVDGTSSTQPAGKLESISAMPVYKEKSHEELRWEDYQAGDKGGPNPSGQSSNTTAFGATNTQSNPFATSSAFGQSASNPFSSATPSNNPFAPKTSAFGSQGFGTTTSAFGSSPFGQTSTSNPFGSAPSTANPFGSAPSTANPFGSAPSTANPFGSAPSTTPSLFGSTGFGTTSQASPFGTTGSSGFGTSPSLFGTGSSQGTTPAFGNTGFGNTQSSPLFQSTAPSLGQTTFGQSSSSFGQSGFGQSNLFTTPSTGFANMFSSTPGMLNTSNPNAFGQSTPSLSTSFQPSQPSQSPFGFNNFGQTQAAGVGGFGGASMLGQNNFGQMPATIQTPVVAQPAPLTNPFGTLPAMPQMSIGRAGTSPSVQYGISSLPVVDKPAPVRISSLLTSRHISQRRIRLPARKYHPRSDGPKVPFFSDEEDAPNTPKADALYIPRENPRALMIRPLETWPARTNASSSKDTASTPPHENGKASEAASVPPLNGSSAGNERTQNGHVKERVNPVKLSQKANGHHEDQSVPTKGSDSYITLTGHRAGEAAIVYEHGADIEALMPKLRHSDYFTEPRIQELAAKERAEPGFCRHVKDFVVGRHEFGNIKFIGETDVRRLDLESLVQFNHREVIVYMDESKKPPIGQGLNKPAEVTLLNIKCFDKKTGTHYTEGPRIDKYKEMLKKKAEDQGAEFVSYDPVKGEWKFRVNHFSGYSFEDGDHELDLIASSLE